MPSQVYQQLLGDFGEPLCAVLITKGFYCQPVSHKHQRLSNCETEVTTINHIGWLDCPIYYKIDSLRDLASAIYSLAKL